MTLKIEIESLDKVQLEDAKLLPSFEPVIALAQERGFRVFSLAGINAGRDHVGFVYLCKDVDGSFVMLCRSSQPLHPDEIEAPITPHSEYGSSVTQDYDGTPEGAVATFEKVCARDDVQVRFLKPGHPAPIVPNIGIGTLTKWGNGMKIIEIVAN